MQINDFRLLQAKISFTPAKDNFHNIIFGIDKDCCGDIFKKVWMKGTTELFPLILSFLT